MNKLLAAVSSGDGSGGASAPNPTDAVSFSSLKGLPKPISQLLNSSNPINSLLHLMFNLIFLAAALLAFAFIMWSGYKMMVSGGDKKVVEESRKIFFNSIIGLTVVMFAFLFVNVVGSFFHLHLFSTTLK